MKIEKNSHIVTAAAPKRKWKERAGFWLKFLLGLFFISPLLIGFVFSFVPSEYLNNLPALQTILDNLTLDNYRFILDYIPIFRFLSNSFIVCAIIILVQVLLSSFAAYAFSFFKFRGSKVLFQLILVAMMIPAEVTVIANYLTIQNWNLINTYIGLCATSLLGGTSIFMMRQSYMQIPKELKEASLVDGCGDMRFLFKIAMPLTIPTIASLAIFLFISAYNMYFWPMLIAQNTDMQTIQIGMAMLVGTENVEYGHVLAGAMISIVIPIAAFIIGQDYLIKGMTSGAVKG